MNLYVNPQDIIKREPSSPMTRPITTTTACFHESLSPSFKGYFIQDLADVLLVLEGVESGCVGYVNASQALTKIDLTGVFELNDTEPGTVWILELPSEEHMSRFEWTDNVMWAFASITCEGPDERVARKALQPTKKTLRRKTIMAVTDQRRYLVLNYFTYSALTQKQLRVIKNEVELISDIAQARFARDGFHLDKCELSNLKVFNISGDQLEDAINTVEKLLKFSCPMISPVLETERCTPTWSSPTKTFSEDQMYVDIGIPPSMEDYDIQQSLFLDSFDDKCSSGSSGKSSPLLCHSQLSDNTIGHTIVNRLSVNRGRSHRKLGV
ncbi:hypothetical protein BKA69DRAFT_1121497 [Paraphysoderma sedebokerense]|nr:hypothetical protein BKA69DRAFT_1121497 [Paraphysoderma sedebokerense]